MLRYDDTSKLIKIMLKVIKIKKQHLLKMSISFFNPLIYLCLSEKRNNLIHIYLKKKKRDIQVLL